MQNFPQPQAVFRYFSELAAIPHGSGNTAQIRAWVLDTAKRLHLDAYADEAGNVIIRKAASHGLETHPTVILQGHMDMVCAKLPDCRKDMETEGLTLCRDEEYLFAEGTTLGGDDGIALAYAFAILEDDSLPHPPLTVIFTVDEETGMDGAAALSPEALDGTYLINLDSEEEGIFTVGCAGGVRVHLHYPADVRLCSGTKLRLTLSGLIGGHSGAEIHKPLLNANLAMLRLLSAPSIHTHLCAFRGGVRDNVIPTDCTAALILSPADTESVCDAIARELGAIRAEYPNETGLTLQIERLADAEETALTEDATECLLAQLSLLPNGVQAMNPHLHMPETSLNLGIMLLDGGVFHVDALIRSGTDTDKAALAQTLRGYAEAAGGTATESGNYPAWEYVPDTALEAAAVQVFRRVYGKEPVIQTIHAGLECGILAAKAPQLQCISIGPDLLDIHTPRERLHLASAKRTWEFLLALLKSL